MRGGNVSTVLYQRPVETFSCGLTAQTPPNVSTGRRFGERFDGSLLPGRFRGAGGLGKSVSTGRRRLPVETFPRTGNVSTGRRSGKRFDVGVLTCPNPRFRPKRFDGYRRNVLDRRPVETFWIRDPWKRFPWWAQPGGKPGRGGAVPHPSKRFPGPHCPARPRENVSMGRVPRNVSTGPLLKTFLRVAPFLRVVYRQNSDPSKRLTHFLPGKSDRGDVETFCYFALRNPDP